MNIQELEETYNKYNEAYRVPEQIREAAQAKLKEQFGTEYMLVLHLHYPEVRLGVLNQDCSARLLYTVGNDTVQLETRDMFFTDVMVEEITVKLNNILYKE